MDIGEQKNLALPYIILPPDQGANSLSLLVSAPDGTLIEFELPAQTAERLDEVLASGGLWKTFFQSLLDSMAHQQESNADG